MEDQREAKVTRVRLTLDDWKELLVQAKRVLDWEQSHHPGIIFGLVTLHFVVIHCWLEPAFTTLISMSLLKLTLLDYFMPFLGPKIYPMDKWGSKQEHEFNVICEAVVDAQNDVVATLSDIRALKAQRPRVYMSLSIGLLVLTAWLGSSLGDAFICYSLALFALLYPGAKKNGIVDAYFGQIMAKLRDVIFKDKSA